MANCTIANVFPVSNVAPAAEPLPEISYRNAMEAFVGRPLESCSRYHGRLLANVRSHPLIAALHAAFATHRPVCLSPDVIWLTIVQGFAEYVKDNAEKLRSRFVSHSGKLKITIRRDDFVKGSPENPWPEVFSEFSKAVGQHVGQTQSLVVADFSTTGVVERAASEIVLLDAMQHYFQYELLTVCGIPSITLEGTVDDWRSLHSRVQEFRNFGLDRWVAELSPVLDQFVDAAAGRVNRRFWDSIYKWHGPQGSGSPHVTGWISTLFFPAPKQSWWAAWKGRTPELTRASFPNRISTAPFRWNYYDAVYEMEFLGGLVGVRQDPQTLLLRPEIGWAVRDAAGPELPPARPSEYSPRKVF